jgi:transposase-like protein
MELIETRHRFIELRGRGYSYGKIEQEIGVNRSTLFDWGRQYEQEIAKFRAIELDTLYESYLMVKQHRLKTLAHLLGKLQAEAERRDFSQLQTDKLLELLLKYDSQLNSEMDDRKVTEPITVIVKRK